MDLISPNDPDIDAYNRLQLKRLKARAQLLEAVALLVTLAVILVIIAPAILLIAWLF